MLRTPSRLADLRGSTQRASAGVSQGPGAAGGWAGDHGTGKVAVGRPVQFSGTSPISTRAREHNSRPVARRPQRRRRAACDARGGSGTGWREPAPAPATGPWISTRFMSQTTPRLPFRHAAERAVAHADGASIVMPGPPVGCRQQCGLHELVQVVDGQRAADAHRGRRLVRSGRLGPAGSVRPHTNAYRRPRTRWSGQLSEARSASFCDKLTRVIYRQ